jgi:hypothetical protein
MFSRREHKKDTELAASISADDGKQEWFLLHLGEKW